MSLAASVRARAGLVALLFGLAAYAWLSTAHRMNSRMMDMRGLGTLGWFITLWVVMMAAMMFPSVAPTVALYSRMTQRRWHIAPLVFTAGYLVTWTAPGLLAYGVWRALPDSWSWHPLVGIALLVAAGYELTPLKNVCLGKCRSPFGFLVGSWRDGLPGAFSMGLRHGAWCVGCCWALMVALIALGVMSLAWMAVVGALIALEKLLPWQRLATYGVAATLAVLACVSLA